MADQPVPEDPTTPASSNVNMQEYRELKKTYSWLTWSMFKVYRDAMIEEGDAGLAWQAVRETEEYQEIFAGNVRDDGTLRFSETEYISRMEKYSDTLREAGVNVRLFRDELPELIRNNVDPFEFQQRVDQVLDRVVFASDEIKAAYAERNGTEITKAGILASLFSPRVGQQILDRTISMAEVEGEAAESGFGQLRYKFLDALVRADMSRAEADALFGQAANMVPILSTLARRHADPDDDFDIEEFASASFFDDPFQRRRMRRLLNQERALFQEGGGFSVARDREGGLTGLEAR